MHDDIELIFKYPLTEVTSEMDNIIYKGLINVEVGQSITYYYRRVI